MLKALKLSIESHLGTTVSDGEAAVTFPISDSLFDSLLSACSSIDLQLVLKKLPPAGLLAAKVYRIGKVCYDIPGVPYPDDQIILAVDYARAALTGMIVAEGCNVF
jgi:hypothetical protein